MDLKRKYLNLVCEICGKEYSQQERVFKISLWPNRCRSHKHKKYNKDYIKPAINYKTHLCSDCGIPICRVSNKCKSCSHKKREQKYCIDCGKPIVYDAKERCLICHNKKQNKGKSTERAKFNNSDLWNKVRIECFTRDNHTCQICHNRGGYLNAHHINSFNKYPLLRLNLNNLITLCWTCHLKLHHNKEFKLIHQKYAS
jgi:5-methylcytosine-specific restriction endonuclease McrA